MIRVICFNLTLTTFARISDRTPVPSSTLPSFTSSKVTPPGSITPFPVLPVKLRAFTWTPLVGRLTVKSDGCCRLQQQVDSQLGALRPGIRCIVGMEDGAQNARRCTASKARGGIGMPTSVQLSHPQPTGLATGCPRSTHSSSPRLFKLFQVLHEQRATRTSNHGQRMFHTACHSVPVRVGTMNRPSQVVAYSIVQTHPLSVWVRR